MIKEIRSADEGFSWFESFTNFEKTPAGSTREFRLDRMHYLASLFDDPHKDYRVIHTAGSKGKGSTSAFLASGLTARGYRTGLYTSPHVMNYRERIRVDGEDIPDDVYLRIMRQIKSRIDLIQEERLPGSGEPTTFELLTLLAFLIFRDLECSWAVLETGLGGRLDATNIVMPEASIITSIELEHTEYLGDTIKKIAREKGGIIKLGRPVFCGNLSTDALDVLREIAMKKEAPFRNLSGEADIKTMVMDSVSGNVQSRDGAFIRTAAGSMMETRIRWKDGSVSRWNLSMSGPLQSENAALAALTLKNLFASGGGYPEDILSDALNNTTLPGRMEFFRHRGSVWVLDGAHTPSSLRSTVQTFRDLYGNEGILIFGSSIGKPTAPLAGETAEHFHDIIITRAGNFKPEDPALVFRSFQKEAGKSLPEKEQAAAEKGMKSRIVLIPEPEEAFRKAEEISKDGRPVLVTGSFYMAGELRVLLLNNQS